MTPRERAGALAGFGLLAGYASVHWFALVADPPLWRWAVCVLAALALAIALTALATRHVRPSTLAVAAGLVVVALGAGLLAAGVPARLLPPTAWGELRSQLDAGLAGISQVELPFAGPSPWTRLGILIAVPLVLTAAAALAFWPRQRRPALRRGGTLALLVGLYAVSVTWESPAAEPLHGLGLLACIAAFLWLGRLPGSRAIAAAAAVLVAGLAALPAAARVDSSDPVIDYAGWELFGAERSASFDWDHSYGPLDWPQRGLELFQVEGARQPSMYWRASVLDEFGGESWRRSAGLAGVLINTPDASDLSAVSQEMAAQRSRWIETLDFSVLGLRSPLLVSPGTPLRVTGVDVELPAPDGTTTVASGGLTQGSDYRVSAYVPDPSAELLRRRDDGHYPRGLERYTTMLLPQDPSVTSLPRAASEATGSLAQFTVPLRGSRRAQDPDPGEPLVGASTYVPVAEAASDPYARIAGLAESITDDARGNYQAVAAIERYLLENFRYEQEVPEREEPLPAFLFEDEAGYCQQFSGAMALMLRMIGIPSRVATGFAMGLPEAESPGRFVVRDTDAHSWVEVWFPRVGWVAVDPTPSAAPARTDVSLNAIAATGPALTVQNRAFNIEEPRRGEGSRDGSSAGGSEEGSPLGAIVVVGLLLGSVALFFVYRRRRARLLAPDGAEPQLRELYGAVPLLGRPAGPWLTLLGIEREFTAALGPDAARYPAGLRHNRFAAGVPRRPGVEERRMVRHALGRGRGLRGHWRAWRAFPPGGPRR